MEHFVKLCNRTKDQNIIFEVWNRFQKSQPKELLKEEIHNGLRKIKMSLYCKDICQQYKAHKSSYEGSYYSNGHKRCTECEMFLQWNGIKCPCCGRILRTKPHNTVSKGKLRLKQEIY